MAKRRARNGAGKVLNADFDRVAGAYVVNLKDQAGRVVHSAGGRTKDQALDRALEQAAHLALATPLGKHPAVRLVAGAAKSKAGRVVLKAAGRKALKIVRQRRGR